jgi:hypothetical protein
MYYICCQNSKSFSVAACYCICRNEIKICSISKEPKHVANGDSDAVTRTAAKCHLALPEQATTMGWECPITWTKPLEAYILHSLFTVRMKMEEWRLRKLVVPRHLPDLTCRRDTCTHKRWQTGHRLTASRLCLVGTRICGHKQNKGSGKSGFTKVVGLAKMFGMLTF